MIIMKDKIKYRLKAYKEKRKKEKEKRLHNALIKEYISGGRIPWSKGYSEYKHDFISKSINSNEVLDSFEKKNILSKFGDSLDERCVEYPWIFSELRNLVNDSIKKKEILDAGSTFNFEFILQNPLLVNSNLTIYTYYPEKLCFWDKRISYVFGDLRKLPFKDSFFDFIVCQSTLEHIDMDNSIYGYDLVPTQVEEKAKSYEYLKVVEELSRVLNSGGKLLITVPYGKFENHGFFQQMDKEMISKMVVQLSNFGTTELSYIKYIDHQWVFANECDVTESTSYNPHTGIGKGDDGAAHSRAICCINFNKE